MLQRLGFWSLNKDGASQNFPVYYTWKNISQHYKDNKVKIIALNWIDETGLPDGSYSMLDIQDYIMCILKNMKKYSLITLFIFTSTGSIIE